jgi:hypothetical protein
VRQLSSSVLPNAVTTIDGARAEDSAAAAAAALRTETVHAEIGYVFVCDVCVQCVSLLRDALRASSAHSAPSAEFVKMRTTTSDVAITKNVDGTEVC